ncbi:hypothetical protein ABT160_06855 [Streptomyces sp. NPDC001941]|uniref:hypothetical protein n=1 Tax=Streptomyces sp. NPDC001941 TaxID=3154659 RepID=UPI003317A532
MAEPAQDTREAPAAPRTPRRGPADPVKALLHRHRELCERAVDPLEIAAGLEAHGVTDRTAARFRHRDVFSLAEELYARVPRGNEPAPRTPAPPGRQRPGAWAALTLLPGAVCALTVLALRTTTGGPRVALATTGVLALAAALAASVRRGPLRAPGRAVPAAWLWTGWLLGYALAGDGLLRALLSGGPDTLWPLTPAPVLALALAVAPAAWSARLFAARARRRLLASRGLDDFASGVRPLLLATVALQLGCTAGLLALVALVLGPVAALPAGALGALLFTARLLTVHGSARAAATGLAAACAAEALSLAAVLAGRLPGCHALAAPVRAAVEALGAGAVPALACGGAALGLLVHATAALSRASAHAT